MHNSIFSLDSDRHDPESVFREPVLEDSEKESCDSEIRDSEKLDAEELDAENSGKPTSQGLSEKLPVDSLRSQIRQLETASRNRGEELRVSTGCESLDAILPGGGMARGSLVEWIAGGNPGRETGGVAGSKNRSDWRRRSVNQLADDGAMLLAFAAAKEACRDGGVFVVLDPHRTFYPPAALAWGFRSRQLLVLQPRSEADLCWSMHQVLNCPAVAAVWGSFTEIEEHTFRRFQLAAESSGCIGFLERPAAAIREPSWSEMKFKVSPRSRCQVLQGPEEQPGWSMDRRVQRSLISGERTRGSHRAGLAGRGFPFQRHGKKYSANRFLHVELVHCRHGQPGLPVLLEVDSYSGKIHRERVDAGGSGLKQKKVAESSAGYRKQDERNQRTAAPSSLSVAAQLAHPKTRRRTTRA